MRTQRPFVVPLIRSFQGRLQFPKPVMSQQSAEKASILHSAFRSLFAIHLDENHGRSEVQISQEA